MELKDLIDNGVYLAESSKNPEFNSLFRLKKPNSLINRMYIDREQFDKTSSSFFDKGSIKEYSWDYHIPTSKQLIQFLECEKAGMYVKIPKEVNLIEELIL